MKIDNVEAQLVDADVKILEKYSNVRTVVQLGVLNGGSCIVSAKKAEQVIGIDVFEKIYLIEDNKLRKHYKGTFTLFKNSYESVTQQLSKYKNITLVQATTIDIIPLFNEKIDMLFIDADHSYEAVKKDFLCWKKFMVINGRVLFHDSHEETRWQGVYHFVEELKKDKDWKFIELDGSISVFQKVK